MSYFSIRLYKKVILHALKEGMSREELNQLPTPLDDIEDLPAVPADHFFQLHEVADQRLGPGFSVRVGADMKIDDYGALGLSWRTCSKVGEIFERSERYFKMLSNTYVFKVEKDDGQSRVHIMREAHRRGVELSNQATFAATVVVLQAMTDTMIAPTSVSFKHSAPSDLADFEAVYKCPILFEQPHNFIAYNTPDLEMRTAKADASINKFLMERVDEETRGIKIGSERIASDVEQLIRDALPSGIPAIADIGSHIGMSPRTLNRRLAESGLNFRKLIRKSQEQVSKDLLKHSPMSVAEIAFQTGFSEQSAFNRAFKRWTGTSPMEFRKN